MVEMEQGARAHILVVVVLVVAGQIAVVDRAAEAEAGVDPVMVVEEMIADLRRPVQAEIAEARAARGIGREADVGPRSEEDLEPFRIVLGDEPLRGGEENFAVDVEPMLDLRPPDTGISREKTQLYLIDDPAAGLGLRRHAKQDSKDSK